MASVTPAYQLHDGPVDAAVKVKRSSRVHRLPSQGNRSVQAWGFEAQRAKTPMQAGAWFKRADPKGAKSPALRARKDWLEVYPRP